MEPNNEIEEIRLRALRYQGKDAEMAVTMTDGRSLKAIIGAEEKHQDEARFNRRYRDPKDGYAEDHKQSPVEKLRQDRDDLALMRQGFRQDWEHAEERAKDERKHGQPGPWTNLQRDLSRAQAEVRERERKVRNTSFDDDERQLLADTDPAVKPDRGIKGGDSGDGDGDGGAPPAPALQRDESSRQAPDVAAKWAAQQSSQGTGRNEDNAERVKPAALRPTLASATKPAETGKVEDGGKSDETAPKQEPDVNPAAARALKTLEASKQAEASKPSIELPSVRRFKV
jgi:hypothetical protein